MNKNCKPNIIVPDYFSVVVVQTINERNDISCKLRQNGMIAVVVEEGYTQYQIRNFEGLHAVCDNRSWIKITEGVESPGNLGYWVIPNIITENNIIK